MELKPIETVYKGYRFRSRLEARWAVFFDAVGIQWDYEIEGFELPSGRYLPDFYLPVEKVWIEIKPGEPSKAENTKASELFEASNKPVVFLCGSPGSETISLVCNDVTDSSGGLNWWTADGMYTDRGRLRFLVWSSRDRDFVDGDWKGVPCIVRWQDLGAKKEELAVQSAQTSIRAAYNNARAARFEFGESGAPV